MSRSQNIGTAGEPEFGAGGCPAPPATRRDSAGLFSFFPESVSRAALGAH
jgi:hypothetical protein